MKHIVTYTTTILTLSTCYAVDNKTILHGILTNPARVLQKTLNTYEKFVQKFEPFIKRHSVINERGIFFSTMVNLEKLQELVQEYTTQYPIFMLTECVEMNSYPCPLSRLKYPRYRQSFEDAVVTACTEKLKKGEALNCVSFASGWGFQDFVILCKLLAKHPYAHISLHIIDPQYTPYAEEKRKFELSTLVTESEKISNPSADPMASLMKYRYQQMLVFLNAVFPHATIRLYPHKDGYTFYKYSEKFGIHGEIDLVYTADIQDNDDTIVDYKILVLTILQKNQKTANIALMYHTTTEYPYLYTLSLHNTKGSIPDHITIKIGENMPKKIQYYQTIRYIDRWINPLIRFGRIAKLW